MDESYPTVILMVLVCGSHPRGRRLALKAHLSACPSVNPARFKSALAATVQQPAPRPGDPLNHRLQELSGL
jgi:hypothetical protein